MALFNIENLTFSYAGQNNNALENVTLEIEEGEFVVLCGQSGCGKTTLLKLLKRELTPKGSMSGKISYCGDDIDKISDRKSAAEIGYVLQNPESQIVTDKVWHEMAFGLESLGADNSLIRRRVSEMACFFGIEKLFRSDTSVLSGGQKQLLSLASIMVMSPKVLLLDEPTSQLDPIAAADFIGTLNKINKEFGTAIIIAEHRLEELFPICDRAIVMESGGIFINETPRKAAEKLDKSHPMMCSMPSAVRIYSAEPKGECPLNVKEGRKYLHENALNKIAELPEKELILSDEIAVEMKDVWFRYERSLPDIMRGVSLKIHKGEIYTILGGNGSGKTTTLNVMAALRKHYRGNVKVFGKKTSEYKNNTLYRHCTAYLPQNPVTVFLKNTVAEDFEDICKSCEYDTKTSADLISEVSRKTGVQKLLQKHPYDLSGGEQQKCAIAKCLLLKPEILLLDEPTKGIDAFAKNNLIKILSELKRENVTVVIVSHDVEFAGEVSDRCAMFFDGEIICEDVSAKFFSGNNYYTTAANRISRGFYKNIVTCGDVIKLIELNGGNNG